MVNQFFSRPIKTSQKWRSWLIDLSKRQKRLDLKIIFAAIIFLPLFSFSCGGGSAPPEKENGESVAVDVNSLAPAFAAKTLEDKTARLSDYAGTKVVLLEFWSISCKSCLQEMPHIEALHKKYATEGFEVLSINTDVFSAKRINKFLNKLKISPPYPVLRDPRQKIIEAYNVELLPVTVIIDKNGWIRLYQEGFKNGDERIFEQTIRKLLGQEADEDITLASSGGVTAFAPTGAALVQKGKNLESLFAVDQNGKTTILGKTQPNILFFWSLYCKPCRAEFPEFEKLAERYGEDVLRVYAINVDSSELKKRVEKFTANYPGITSLMDSPSEEGGSLAKKLGVIATPTVVLIDSKGVVAYVKESLVDAKTLQDNVTKLLETKPSE